MIEIFLLIYINNIHLCVKSLENYENKIYIIGIQQTTGKQDRYRCIILIYCIMYMYEYKYM